MAEYANPAALVTADWVAEHGDDVNVRLVEVDVDTTAYESGHIPGAVGWNWQSQLSDNIRRDIVDQAGWEELLSSAGIANDTCVVLYGDNNNWFAAFAYWQFKLYGHPDVHLLNGGRVKWELDGRELSTDPVSYPRTNYQANPRDDELRAYQPQVLGALDRDVVLIDVRAPAEFRGEIMAPPGLPETAQRMGRIPGAANVPWATAVNSDGTFKSAAELSSIYGAKGVSKGQETIAYCRIGERSSHTWFVLKELIGVSDVRNYDGSWTEWGSMIGTPVEVG
jgi:thiosulfate/3-mercaptopyruvate sulfurtransferase